MRRPTTRGLYSGKYSSLNLSEKYRCTIVHAVYIVIDNSNTSVIILLFNPTVNYMDSELYYLSMSFKLPCNYNFELSSRSEVDPEV